MSNKIIEVMARILEGLKNNSSFDEVNKMLNKDKKLDKQTVSAAFSWILEKILIENSSKKVTDDIDLQGIRFLTEEEIDVLGHENYGYLLHLSNLGLLDSFEIDFILNQIFFFPEKSITKEEINWIVLFALVGYNDTLLPGSRVMLFSSDTIN